MSRYNICYQWQLSYQVSELLEPTDGYHEFDEKLLTEVNIRDLLDATRFIFGSQGYEVKHHDCGSVVSRLPDHTRSSVMSGQPDYSDYDGPWLLLSQLGQNLEPHANPLYESLSVAAYSLFLKYRLCRRDKAIYEGVTHLPPLVNILVGGDGDIHSVFLSGLHSESLR